MPLPLAKPVYLGDGAYVQFTEIGLTLYTSDGVQETNRVVLGDSELKAFLDYLEVNHIITWQIAREDK